MFDVDINQFKNKVEFGLSQIKDFYSAKGSGISGRNRWLAFNPVGEIYVIVNSLDRYPSGKFNPLGYKTLILSSVSLSPKFVGRGIYRYMLADLEAWADQNGVHIAVENILYHRFWEFHVRRGYELYQPCSLYRKPVTVAKVA